MKITLISNFFPPTFVGGAEIYAYTLGKELARNGIDVNVITNFISKYEIYDEIDGMKVYRMLKALPISRVMYKFFGCNFNPYSYKLKALLKKTNPDIIHLHNIHTAPLLYPLIKYLNAPVISHIHDHWPICYKGTLFNERTKEFCTEKCVKCSFRPGFRMVGFINLTIREILVKKFEEKVDCFITPSRYLKETLVNKGFSSNEKIIHIPLGVNVNDFNPTEKQLKGKNPTILFVGRLTSYKNPALVIKILPKILEHVKCKYEVIGLGPEIGNIESLSKKYNVMNYVKIMGKVSSEILRKRMAQADLVVVPSILPENSPVVIYESMASGTPVAVTSYGGAKELIDDGINGYILDPVDEDEWIKKIVGLLTNENFKNKMSENARKKAEKEFNIKNHAQKIIEVYSSVLNREK